MSERTVNIIGCARCGCDHVLLTVKEFLNPITLENSVATHWATCPSTEEPILISFVNVEDSS